jgi:hypothetical protein
MIALCSLLLGTACAFCQTVLAFWFWIPVSSRTCGLTSNASYTQLGQMPQGILQPYCLLHASRPMLDLSNLLLHADFASWCLLLSYGAGTLHH